MPSSEETKGKYRCIHGKSKYTCQDCKGSGLCEHGQVKSVCKECGGSGICEHGRVKSVCKECGGSYICEHGLVKSVCKECGGRGSNTVPPGKRRRLNNRIENIRKELEFLKNIEVRSNLILVGTKILLLLQ